MNESNMFRHTCRGSKSVNPHRFEWYRGPIRVRGKEFNGVEPAWRDVLSDAEIAAVLTYIRNNTQWGHALSPVSSSQVKTIREATKSRTKNWTAAELMAIPEND